MQQLSLSDLGLCIELWLTVPEGLFCVRKCRYFLFLGTQNHTMLDHSLVFAKLLSPHRKSKGRNNRILNRADFSLRTALCVRSAESPPLHSHLPAAFTRPKLYCECGTE
jgi:hypothetical protein